MTGQVGSWGKMIKPLVNPVPTLLSSDNSFTSYYHFRMPIIDITSSMESSSEEEEEPSSGEEEERGLTWDTWLEGSRSGWVWARGLLTQAKHEVEAAEAGRAGLTSDLC